MTSGVPLPKGAVKTTGELALKNASGKVVPCQFDTVIRWSDGSVKWVDLNFQADVAPSTENKYRLGKGKTVAPVGPVKVTDGANTVTVDTGTISFTVPKKKGAIIGNVTVGGKLVATGQGLVIVGAKGEQKGVAFTTLNGTVEQVVVERSGPMMVRVYIVITCFSKDGKPYIDVAKSRKKYTQTEGDWFKVRVRLHAYAAKPTEDTRGAVACPTTRRMIIAQRAKVPSRPTPGTGASLTMAC